MLLNFKTIFSNVWLRKERHMYGSKLKTQIVIGYYSIQIYFYLKGQGENADF